MSSETERSFLGTREGDFNIDENIDQILSNDELLQFIDDLDLENKKNKEELIRKVTSLKIQLTLEDSRNKFLIDRIKKLEAVNKSLTEKNEGLKKDLVTGLFNRAYLPRALERLGDDTQFSLLFLDMNKFKTINDTYGHPVGDLALRYLANKIQGSIRGDDMIAKCDNSDAIRWAGDEFIILLADTDLSGAISVAERLNKNLKDDRFSFVHEDKLFFPESNVSVSVGIASGKGAKEFSDVLECADQAAYQVKKHMNRKGISVSFQDKLVSSEEFKKYINKN